MISFVFARPSTPPAPVDCSGGAEPPSRAFACSRSSRSQKRQRWIGSKSREEEKPCAERRERAWAMLFSSAAKERRRPIKRRATTMTTRVASCSTLSRARSRSLLAQKSAGRRTRGRSVLQRSPRKTKQRRTYVAPLLAKFSLFSRSKREGEEPFLSNK